MSEELKQQEVDTCEQKVVPLNQDSENPSTKKNLRQKGIYLLPNLFTTGALFSGFYAIVASMNGHFEKAAIAVFIAMILDGLDGRVARLTNTQSDFGAEYDSLADMVSFGVAPALVAFTWALQGLGNFGWIAAFIYVAGAALRLARFNTQIDTADKRFFIGLASPAAAAVVAGTVWAFHDSGVVGRDISFLVALVVAGSGILMVSNVKYYSFKDVDFKGAVPFVAMLAVVGVFALISLDPPLVLVSGFLIYALSGPFVTVHEWRKERKTLKCEDPSDSE